MSCMERKIVLRIELPQLKDKTTTEAYEYFKSILGVANEIDEWEGEIEFFSYDKSIQPITDWNGSWGVDYVLHHSSGYKTYIGENFNGLTLKEFEERAFILSDLFGIKYNNVKLMSYNWYNGGDEPVTF